MSTVVSESSVAAADVTSNDDDVMQVVELDDNKSLQKFVSQTPAFPSGFVKVQPYNQVLPRVFLKDWPRIKSFKAKENDIWISSFPKCGTTWTQEMVWCIMNNLDFEKAKSTLLDERVKYLELSSVTELEEMQVYGSTIDLVENQAESPRIIKTHLSWKMLPEDVKSNDSVKIIYVTRNPKDACVSLYNHWKVLEGYTGSLEDFVSAFLGDVCGYYAPFIHHVLEYWEVRERSNVCFITFEEMKKDLASVIRKVSAFLGKPVQEQQMDSLLTHLSFDKMKDNKAVNKQEFVQASIQATKTSYEDAKFMKKGQVGNWKSKLTPQMEQQFDEWEAKWLKDSDFKFTYLI